MTLFGTDKSALIDLRNEVVRKSAFECSLTPFDEQDSWIIKSGAISHKSGGFFHVLGVAEADCSKEQIVLYQPQSALTGVLIARRDETVWVCLQARAEPGNTGLVQFGPTIQSTAANYLKLHGGRDTDFLSHFQSYPGGSRLISFTMQTDLGGLYYQKSKTHNYIEVDEFKSASDNTIWVPLPLINKFCTWNYFLNTDLRSLLSMFNWDNYFIRENFPDEPNTELLSYYLSLKNNQVDRYRLTPLDNLKTWELHETGLRSLAGDNLYVELYNIQAITREVTSWVQPLIGTRGKGLVRLYRKIDAGVPKYLISVIEELGINGRAIMAPSVMVYPGGDKSSIPEIGELFRHFEHSEEGGRFKDHESIFEIRNVGKDFAEAENEFWVTAAQLKQLFLLSNVISIQLRVIASALLDELNPLTLSQHL